MLDEVIKVAIEDNTFRSDDLEFTFAARVSTSNSDSGTIHTLDLAHLVLRGGRNVFPSGTSPPIAIDLKRFKNFLLQDFLRLAGWAMR